MTMPNFSQRSHQRELMDGNDLTFAEFDHCLRSLERINVLTLAYRPTLDWIKAELSRTESRTILDAGCGGGDMLRRIENMARKNGLKVELTGIDLNPWSKEVALSMPSSAIQYETADIFTFYSRHTFDYIICSLFTHHLDDDQIVEYLRWIDRSSKRGWFINDLHRHPLPYYFIKTATSLFSNNRLIRHDAAVSVARSFTVTNWQSLLARAGLKGRAEVKWYFPFRICVACRK